MRKELGGKEFQQKKKKRTVSAKVLRQDTVSEGESSERQSERKWKDRSYWVLRVLG